MSQTKRKYYSTVARNILMGPIILLVCLLWSLPASAQGLSTDEPYATSFRTLTGEIWKRFEVEIGTQRFTVFDSTLLVKAPAGMKAQSVKITVKPTATAAEWEAEVRKQYPAKLAQLVKKASGATKMGIPPFSKAYQGPDSLAIADQQRGIALGTWHGLTSSNRTLTLSIAVQQP